MNSQSLWNIFLAVGTAVGVIGSFITDPADYGLSQIALNWVRLIGAVMAAVGGAFGHSILKGNSDAPKE